MRPNYFPSPPPRRQIRKPQIWNPIPPEDHPWIYVYKDSRERRSAYHRNHMVDAMLVPDAIDCTREGIASTVVHPSEIPTLRSAR